MNKLPIILLILLISCGREKPKGMDYDAMYNETAVKMRGELNKLGNWKYSPDGKDSLWEKTIMSRNLKLQISRI